MREIRWLRVFAVIWAICSFAVAFCAFMQMFVTFAPPRGRSLERGQEDLRLMYGVVSSLTLFDWAASAMLAVNAVLVMWLALRLTSQAANPTHELTGANARSAN